MKWRDVKPDDVVFHQWKAKRVISITHLDQNVWDTTDHRPHVEVMFHDPDAPWFSYTDGFYCILASKTVRPVQ